MFPGVSDYGNYNGYNLRYVPDLHQALLHYGWSASSSGTWCGSSGQVSAVNIFFNLFVILAQCYAVD